MNPHARSAGPPPVRVVRAAPRQARAGLAAEQLLSTYDRAARHVLGAPGIASLSAACLTPEPRDRPPPARRARRSPGERAPAATARRRDRAALRDRAAGDAHRADRAAARRGPRPGTRGDRDPPSPRLARREIADRSLDQGRRARTRAGRVGGRDPHPAAVRPSPCRAAPGDRTTKVRSRGIHGGTRFSPPAKLARMWAPTPRRVCAGSGRERHRDPRRIKTGRGDRRQLSPDRFRRAEGHSA